MVLSQIEEEQKQEELRRTQAALLEKQEKNDKKKENEEFLNQLVIKTKILGQGGGRGYSQKNWVRVCDALPKTPTLFMTYFSGAL